MRTQSKRSRSKQTYTVRLPLDSRPLEVYLPYWNMDPCMTCMDDQTLARECVNVHTILKALKTPKDKRQVEDSQVKLWRGYEALLTVIGVCAGTERRERGYPEPLLREILLLGRADVERAHKKGTPIPSWFGDENFHSMHRASLIAFMPSWYRRHGWIEQPRQIVWPTTRQSRVQA